MTAAPTLAEAKLIDAAPDHVGEDDTSDLKKGSAVRVSRTAQSGEAAEVVDPKDETIRDLLEVLAYARTAIRLSLIMNGDGDSDSEVLDRIDAAILKATGGKDD